MRFAGIANRRMFDTVHAVEWDGEEFVPLLPATDQQPPSTRPERCGMRFP